jgi:hypothetical protein
MLTLSIGCQVYKSDEENLMPHFVILLIGAEERLQWLGSKSYIFCVYRANVFENLGAITMQDFQLNAQKRKELTVIVNRNAG